jgi:hypothetical protein
MEVSEIVIGAIPKLDVIEWLKNPDHFPSPRVVKDKFLESDAESMFINVLDIFDEFGCAITHKFKFHGTAIYYVEDQDWLDENTGTTKAVVSTVIPHVDELLPEDMEHIMRAIIEGCKYYFNDTLQTTNDAQVANLFYQRYWQKKQELVNTFPTQVFSCPSKRTWL